VSSNVEKIDAGNRRNAAGSDRAPRTLRLVIAVLAAALVAGALYLLAVRGDALLADLTAIAALICG
jgi:hypothetical protein